MRFRWSSLAYVVLLTTVSVFMQLTVILHLKSSTGLEYLQIECNCYARSGHISFTDNQCRHRNTIRNSSSVTRRTSAIAYKGIVNKPSADLSTLGETWRYDAMLYKMKKLRQRLLTIGIPTIRRVQDEYIFGTIHSLINCTTAEELNEIYIVIFLADFDQAWKTNVTERFYSEYRDLILSGTLQLIEAPKEFYPPLSNLTHTYNDPQIKRKWRSKQNVDYAYIFLYSQYLSKYYIQMEDDIYTIPNYLTVIKDYIAQFTTPWTCLEFSELGFIGKLYHSHDLEKLAKMVLLFYEEQPCDFTYIYFNIQMLQFNRYIRKPTIFQHVGIHSSLPGKIQPLKDRFFDNIQKEYKGDNPSAKTYTNMEAEPPFLPEMAYTLEDGFFWSKGGKQGDVFTLVFDEPQHVDKVIVETGSREHRSDKIESGKLEASLTLVSVVNNIPKCTNDLMLGVFEDGKVVAKNLKQKLGPFKIHCLRITVTKDQNWWIIIKEIAVFLSDTT